MHQDVHRQIARPGETGGVALGRDSDDYRWAVVEMVTGPPDDSKRFNSVFIRGIKGLQSLLASLWYTQRRYYIGEWHFHPGQSSSPSNRDAEQMMQIAANPKAACPEPVLLIVGGSGQTMEESSCFVAIARLGLRELRIRVNPVG
jgi:integrative and conjugative element protein (TIGR02256 family)